MKILQHTKTSLQWCDRDWNWLVGLWIAIPFTTVGCIIMLTVSNLTTLHCRRSPNSGRPGTQMTCDRTISGWLGTDRLHIPEPIMRASVQTAHGTGVVLFISKTPNLELANHRSMVGPKHTQIAEEINQFIQNPNQPELIVNQDDRLEGLLGGLMFLLPGLVIGAQGLAIPMKILCKLDRATQHITIEKHYRLGQRQVITMPLSSVHKAEVVESNASTQKKCYVLELKCTDHPAVPVSALALDFTHQQQAATAINQWLHSSCSHQDS